LVLETELFELHFNVVVQKIRFPLRSMTSVMASGEYGIQPKSPILT
jgi:hypothetical protein